MPAARCTICALNFPLDEADGVCPVCDEAILDGIENAQPDDAAELASKVAHAEFERFLIENDRA